MFAEDAGDALAVVGQALRAGHGFEVRQPIRFVIAVTDAFRAAAAAIGMPVGTWLGEKWLPDSVGNGLAAGRRMCNVNETFRK